MWSAACWGRFQGKRKPSASFMAPKLSPNDLALILFQVCVPHLVWGPTPSLLILRTGKLCAIAAGIRVSGVKVKAALGWKEVPSASFPLLHLAFGLLSPKKCMPRRFTPCFLRGHNRTSSSRFPRILQPYFCDQSLRQMAHSVDLSSHKCCLKRISF